MTHEDTARVPYATQDEVLTAEQALARRFQAEHAPPKKPRGDFLNTFLHELHFEVALDLLRALALYTDRAVARDGTASFEGHVIRGPQDEPGLYLMFRSGWRRAGTNLWTMLGDFLRTTPGFARVLAGLSEQYIAIVMANQGKDPAVIADLSHRMTYQEICRLVDRGNPAVDAHIRNLQDTLQEGLNPARAQA